MGNFILAALTQQYGSLHAAVQAVCQSAGLRQRVLPVSDGDTHIGAELRDGQCIVGEWEIMQRQPRTPMARLFLQPPVAAHAAVLEAIAGADLVVLCPGSLLTGTIALLLHPGVQEALTASQAPCVYVCNLMTQPGQTDGYTARQHLAILTVYLGRRVDAVILNNGPLPADVLALYAHQGAYPVVNDLTEAEVPVYLADVVERPDTATLRSYARPQGAGMAVGLHLIRHEARCLASQIMAIAADLPSPSEHREG